MAPKNKSDIPDYKEKQKLLYIKETPPETLLEIAERLMEIDRFSDAYDYIDGSEDEKRMEKYMQKALERGDYFNFERASLWLDIEVETPEWEKLGNNALNSGMFIDAVDAFRRSGNRGKADEVIRKHPEFFGPVLEMDRQKAKAMGKLDLTGEPDK